MYQKSIDNKESKEHEHPETELVKLTGLWEGKTKNGKVYYSGKAEDGTKFMLFHNEYWSESNNQPNLNLCISREVKK